MYSSVSEKTPKMQAYSSQTQLMSNSARKAFRCVGNQKDVAQLSVQG